MFCYTISSAMQSGTYSTSGTPGAEIDVMFTKPGVRNMSIYALRGQGRGAGLTALTGISINVKQWTTASTGGTALTPAPNDVNNQAAKATVGIGTGGGTNAVSSGSGGPTYRGGFGFGGSGPGGWVAATPDAALTQPGGGAASFDLFSVSGTASMLYEFWQEHME